LNKTECVCFSFFSLTFRPPSRSSPLILQANILAECHRSLRRSLCVIDLRYQDCNFVRANQFLSEVAGAAPLQSAPNPFVFVTGGRVSVQGFCRSQTIFWPGTPKKFTALIIFKKVRTVCRLWGHPTHIEIPPHIETRGDLFFFPADFYPLSVYR
jgi:hypothetical protein